MLPPFSVLRWALSEQLRWKAEQGFVTDGIAERLAAVPDSYDALQAFARTIVELPLRDGWPWVEPDLDLAAVRSECESGLSIAPIGTVAPAEAAARAEAGFLASVCGCMLGKPLEISPTLAETKSALQAIGEWPLDDYVSARIAPGYDRPLHHSWRETTREGMTSVAADDDINYSIIGMLALEQHGLGFTRDHLRHLWLEQLPINTTFGPERLVLVRAGLNAFRGQPWQPSWIEEWNFREEFCGALIRADAYGYACQGRPGLAALLAWKDATLTHRRTGVYGTMFVAAAIAAAAVVRDPLEVFREAARHVPKRTRFRKLVDDSLADVAAAGDWEDGYARIHGKYGEYVHCRVLQEVGTMINTLRFARDPGHGICLQVMQGNDTDSFGATCGSILGVFHGPGRLEPRWLAPFHDDLRVALALFHERSLSAVAKRMGRLPALAERQLAAGVDPLASTPSAATSAPGSAAAGIRETSPCRG